MPTDASPTPARARTTVTLLREELAGLGFPEDIVRQVIPTADVEGRPLIRMGASWDVDSADRLLAALSDRRTPAGAAS
jgi:hypothetical protein